MLSAGIFLSNRDERGILSDEERDKGYSINFGVIF